MRLRQRGAEEPPLPAAAVQRLAVLLEAGVSAPRAWQLLAEDGDPSARHVVAAPPGVLVADVLRGRGAAWGELAVAWQVAETVGAPLAPSLRRFADALRDAQECRDDVAVALADPASTARLVGWLPFVAVALSLALGFDVLGALTQPAGLACAALGLALIAAARRWSARLVRSAQPPAGLPGLQADVVAIALSAGVSIERALAVVSSAGGGEPDGETTAILRLSERAGAPAVDLLRAGATETRRQTRTAGRLRAARLGSRLLLPMGLCTLPAFLLLGVGPMLLSVVSGTLPTFAPP